MDLPIRTERLLLRAWTEDDLDPYCAMYGDVDTVRFLYWGVRAREELADALRIRTTWTDPREHVVLAIELDGVVVGEISLFVRSPEQPLQGEIGWILRPGRSGHGYATEAARALLGVGFAVGLHRICANCDDRNDASVAIMERLGMRREAHMLENEWVKGEWTGAIVYARLASEAD